MFAQALGRWGNWFNNELFGGPTSLPWRLQIHKIDVVTGHLTQCDVGNIGTVGVCGYYQPTFLYESLWDIALGFALHLRRAPGRSSARATCSRSTSWATRVGRGWIEALREDHANHILGVRLNDWTALLVFLGAAIWFYVHRDAPTDSLYRPRPAGRPADRADAAAEPDEPTIDGRSSTADAGRATPTGTDTAGRRRAATGIGRPACSTCTTRVTATSPAAGCVRPSSA